MSLIQFATEVRELVPFTNKISQLDRGLDRLRLGDATALYDAIYFACKDKLQHDQPSTKYRRAIVLLSDGDDNNSRYTRDQALEMAQKADAVMYADGFIRSPHQQPSTP